MPHNKHRFSRSTAELKILSSNRPIFTLSVVEIVSSTSANFTISALEKTFSEHGLISDNGPPFKSSQISTYMKNSRITHNQITFLHPRPKWNS